MSLFYSLYKHSKATCRISPLFFHRLFIQGHIAESREAYFTSTPSDNLYAFFQEPNLIIEDLYLGSGYHAAQWEWLEDNNIKNIVNVALEVPNFFTDDLSYLECQSIKDDGLESFDSLDNIIDSIHNCLEKKEKVYIHCLVGRSRSATIIIAYLMKYKNMALLEAVHFVREKREVVNPSLKLMNVIEEWWSNKVN
tara:strand:- start:23 stop:607 length:585 start_codon:yes stop_codon:yes gene_type:complete